MDRAEPSALTGSRAAAPELWFLRLQRASHLPSAFFGLLIGIVVFAFVATPLLFADGALGPAGARDLLSSAAFFAASLGFLFGAAPVIFPAAVRDLERLAPVLDVDAESLDALRRSLVRMPAARLRIQALIGVVLGVMHAALLSVGAGNAHFDVDAGALLTPQIATVLLWLMMFQIAAPMLTNATLFDRLGRSARVDLLRPQALYPFGAAALRPTLFVIGLQCAYPLLALGSEEALTTGNLIGLGVSALLVAGLFYLPMRGVRRRVSRAREDALATLDARIGRLTGGDTARIATAADATLAQLEPLLALRERVLRTSGWPLGLAALRRVLLYVILPPMTWVGAALVEMLIDSSL